MFKNNLSSLKTRHQSQCDIIATLETSLNEINNQKQKITSDYEALKSAHRHLLSEAENLRLIIKNLETENQILHDEKVKNHPLLLQFQQISSQLDNIDLSYKSGISSHVSEFKDEITSLRLELSSLTSQSYSEKIVLQHDLDNLKSDLSNEKLKHQTTREKLSNVLQQLENETKSPASFPIQPIFDTIDSNTVVQNLNQKIIEFNIQIEQYKSICDASETKLSQFTLQHQNLIDSFDKEKEKWQEKSSLYEEKILNQQNQLSDALRELDETKNSEGFTINANYADQIDSLNKNVQRLSRLNVDLSDRYDQSVISHSNTLKRLNEGLVKIQANDNLIEQLKARITQLEEDLTLGNQKLVAQNADLAVWNEKKLEAEFLQKQETDLLYIQINKLKSQLQNVRHDFNSSQSQLEESNYSIDSSTNEDVWRLLDFARKERSLVQGRLELSQAECARFSEKCVQLHDRIRAAEQSLQAEREINYSNTSSIENLSVYKEALDSQVELQREKSSLECKLLKMEEKMSFIEKELTLSNFNAEHTKEELFETKKLYDSTFSKNDILDRQLLAAKKNIDHLKERLLTQNSNENLTQKYNIIMNKHSELINEIEAFKIKENTHTKFISKLQYEIENLTNSLNSKNIEINNLKENLQNLTERSSQSISTIQNEISESKLSTPIFQQEIQTRQTEPKSIQFKKERIQSEKTTFKSKIPVVPVTAPFVRTPGKTKRKSAIPLKCVVPEIKTKALIGYCNC
ncbi:hypothetical protein MXB_3910 [Myxobolus squamalis]|nr:hypothetical protein MXB_3910 [Myxobolus squamalis]